MTAKIRFINSIKAPFKRYIKTGNSLYYKRHSLHGSQVTMPFEIDNPDAATPPQNHLRSALRNRSKYEQEDIVYENTRSDDNREVVKEESPNRNPNNDNNVDNSNANTVHKNVKTSTVNSCDKTANNNNDNRVIVNPVQKTSSANPAQKASIVKLTRTTVSNNTTDGTASSCSSGFVDWDDINDPDYIPLPGEPDGENNEEQQEGK